MWREHTLQRAWHPEMLSKSYIDYVLHVLHVVRTGDPYTKQAAQQECQIECCVCLL